MSARGGPEDCLGAGEAVVAEAALAVCAGKRRSVGANPRNPFHVDIVEGGRVWKSTVRR